MSDLLTSRLSARHRLTLAPALLGALLLSRTTRGSAAPLALDPTAADLIKASSEQLATTETLRFELKVDGETFIDDLKSMRLLEAKGELVRPDKVRVDFKLEILKSVTISTAMIIIGDKRWSTDLITGKWGAAPPEFGYDPSTLFDNQDGLGPVMNRLVDPKLDKDEDVNDRKTHHLSAEVEDTVIALLTAKTMKGSPITVDLWIDAENNDLLRANLAEPDTITDHKPATWTLDLKDHRADIKIEPPV